MQNGMYYKPQNIWVSCLFFQLYIALYYVTVKQTILTIGYIVVLSLLYI